MAKWNAMADAPKDRDFLVELNNGYITRGRLINGKHFGADSLGPGGHQGFDTSPKCWQDLPKPSKSAPRAKSAYTEEFEREVWGPYPRKEGTSKIAAFRKYQALSDADQLLVKRGIPIYARQKAGSEPQFIMHLEFFISKRIFETLGRGNHTVPQATTPIPTQYDWKRTLEIYRATNNWNPALGPEPGQFGCRVPPEALRAVGL